MVLEDQTGWKLRRRKWTGTIEQLIEDLESAYGNDLENVYQWSIFDMVNIDLFTVVALNMMVIQLGHTGESEPLFYHYLRPLPSLDEGLPPQFRATIEEITDEPSSIAPVKHRFKKMLLLTWHDSSELTKKPVCESVTPSSLLEHDSSTPSVESSGLIHDESFGVDDFDLNLNEPMDLNVSQIKTQSELPVLKEPNVVRSLEPVVVEVRTQEPIMEEEDESAASDGQFFYDDEGIVDEENEIVEPDVDVHLFGISMDVLFDNIVVTNLVPNDVLEGENVDVINAGGFNNDPDNDDETSNYRRRSLTELSREMEEVQISISKAFRAKAKAERDIKGDYVLQYSMLKDYVVELQATNPNTTVKIVVERNTDPSLPARVFLRIYVCLGALKLGFRACRRELLGLDGAFMKGPFSGQALAAVRLYSNNGMYPLAYALVEAESGTTLRSMGKSLLLVDYMEGNILSQGGNNAEANGSASRQAQQAEPVVGQDGSGVGAVIGFSAADGAGRAVGAGVGAGFVLMSYEFIRLEIREPTGSRTLYI
nr:transposase, MuDR, MULE transposase domain protein [Tanacetum cinerariifolium]